MEAVATRQDFNPSQPIATHTFTISFLLQLLAFHLKFSYQIQFPKTSIRSDNHTFSFLFRTSSSLFSSLSFSLYRFPFEIGSLQRRIMGSELVEIQPQILRFTFELKKQSSCTIQLTNKTEHFVAFKVKTTSPKKYCVKPNVGVIKPRSKSDFTVIMQAQNTDPPDLLCKDKFLVQTTVVPFGLTEENITSDMFVKDPSKHIHEKRLKVILVNPPISTESPLPLPVNGGQKQDLLPDTPIQKDKAPGVHEYLLPCFKDGEGAQSAKNTEETGLNKDAETKPVEDTDELRMAKHVDSREVGKVDEEQIPNADMDSKFGKEVDDLSLKLNDLESKLSEADEAVSKLTEERSRVMFEKEMLEQELEVARSKSIVKRVYMGYPLLYVCMVGICSLTFGYLVHQ